ncbi:MAG: GNAT family N-acetyltransferase [Methylophilaceae bacterium]
MEEIIIGDARQEDIPDLVHLLDELFSIEQDFTPDHVKQAQGLALLIANPSSARIKIARNEQGKVIGMVSAQLVISTAQGAPSAWVEDMVVSVKYRGKGIGKTLLESVLAWAKENGATRAQLLMDISNEPASGYYSHLGWQSTLLQARRVFL